MSIEFGNLQPAATSKLSGLAGSDTKEQQMLIGCQQQQQQTPASNLPAQMIVNSLPYNPSQKSQQQRCVGLSKPEQNMDSNNNNNNRMSSGGVGLTSQQNALYGSNFNTAGLQPQQSHMLDLANLQQGIPFEPNYDVAGNMLNNGNPNENRNHLNKRQPTSDIQNDLSLYSPSSSTSLLYHIYDQINLPNEHYQQQQRQQQQQQHLAAEKKNTTILNPANLFGGQQQQPYQMQLHQQQLSRVSDLQKSLGVQPQQCYSTSAGSASQYQIQQQQAFNASTMHQASYLASHQSGLVLDSVLRQHQATTLARQHQQRPLSSSAASSMSGQSGGQLGGAGSSITYGRQPRPAAASKSQSNLANVLQASNTLNHLAIIHRAGQGSASPSQLGVPIKGAFFAGSGGGAPSRPFKRLQLRFRHLAYEYRTVAKCAALIIILALSLMSLIKIFLLSASTTSSSQTTSSSPLSATQAQNQASNTFLYPPFPKLPPSVISQPPDQPNPETPDADSATSAEPGQDVLKSKLLIGEFVILSQNYSHSQVHKAILAERIVKLMDQVFLANADIRRIYHRMEVTSIRANRPIGIIVDCNIVLTESIAYAAQQFGIALYDSLTKSQERLANQVNYIIDKNSIRFNTVPDKDLNSGIVPPGLISPSVFGSFSPERVAPSVHQSPTAFEQNNNPLPPPPSADNLADQMNMVVWSEWSQWSSCVDKNGVCDPTRLHSRLRKCVAQHTGEKVEAAQCKQRFNTQDQELEVADCSRTCSQQAESSSHIMSDAPSMGGPQTAPSVMIGPHDEGSLPKSSAITSGAREPVMMDVYPISASSTSASASANAAQTPTQTPTTERSAQLAASPANEVLSSSLATPTLIELQAGSQVSCSNCTSDEICLLIMTQKVPFCAKIKDRSDQSGCGGWCKAQNQLCQPVGQNAFKCIHDSECLPEEWRCHDSACIPLSKRCDGHSNCYDSSDERDCAAM